MNEVAIIESIFFFVSGEAAIKARSSGYSPTCHDAYGVCRLDVDCISNYNEFKMACDVRRQECQMRNRDLCRTYLAKMQRTPLYGCVCNSKHGQLCRRIHATVNRNPCVDIILKSEFSKSVKNKRPKITQSYKGTYVGESKPDSSPDLDLTQEKIFSSTEITDGLDGYRRDGNGIILTTIHYPISHESGMKPPSEYDDDGSYQGSSEFDSTLMNSESWPRFHLHQKFSWKIESTCPSAVLQCNRDYTCKRLLQHLVRRCETMPKSCSRRECMQAVKNLYQHGPHRLVQALAFCICKQTDSSCIEQQRTVLPVCAEMSENRRSVPSCNKVIEECRRDNRCGPQMTVFIDACAMNTSSHGCLHDPVRCRLAVLDVLGTKLRTRCNCRGGNYKSHYMCLDWQRLLWLNPCVVQAQFDFHSKPISSVSKTVIARPAPSSVITAPVTTRHIWSSKNDDRVLSTDNPRYMRTKAAAATKRPFIKFIPKKKTTKVTTTTTTMAPYYKHEIQQNINNKSCVVGDHTYEIMRGSRRRIFDDPQQQCSILCECNSVLQNLCSSLRCKTEPCSTKTALYHHSSVSYDLERDQCVCFGGAFVCTKPKRHSYSLPKGLFLFTGYSQEDLSVLRENKRTTRIERFSSKDALKQMQFLMNRHVRHNKCKLLIFKEIGRNIIFQAYLLSDNNSIGTISNTADKAITLDRCLEPLEKLADYINNKKKHVPYEIHLSLMKIAKVEKLIIPEKRFNSSTMNQTNIKSIFLSFFLMFYFTHLVT
ncbi:Uncharacterised protein g4465 [Pycnogonum litorale]